MEVGDALGKKEKTRIPIYALPPSCFAQDKGCLDVEIVKCEDFLSLRTTCGEEFPFVNHPVGRKFQHNLLLPKLQIADSPN